MRRRSTELVALVGVAAAALMAGPAWAQPLTATDPYGIGTYFAKSYGPDFSLPDRPSAQAAGDDWAVTEYDLSVGCIIGGVTGTGLAVGAGGLNVVNLIAGGLVSAASPTASYLALGGVVFASFCAVGQALTPAIMAGYGYFVPALPGRSAAPLGARYCEAAAPFTLADRKGRTEAM